MGKVKFPRRGSNLVFKGGTKSKKNSKGGLKKSKGGIGTFFGDKTFSNQGIRNIPSRGYKFENSKGGIGTFFGNQNFSN